MSCLLAICLTLGVTANSYDTLKPTYAYHFTAGNDTYAWLSYESQKSRLLGQAVSAVDIYSVGVGARYKVDKFFGFIEAGYAVLDSTPNLLAQYEVVYTQLVRNHNVIHRPIPVTVERHYGQDSYETSYDLENGYVGRVGVGYQHKHWKITAAYRFLSVQEHYELWDADNRAAGLGWWEESHGRDLSAFELGVSWEF